MNFDGENETIMDAMQDLLIAMGSVSLLASSIMALPAPVVSAAVITATHSGQEYLRRLPGVADSDKELSIIAMIGLTFGGTVNNGIVKSWLTRHEPVGRRVYLNGMRSRW